ncbi:uncharacterized SAM-binding protein YcdF (DUF218 family) [Melghirimyces profundicolus]|uniref:Uncharacterized SAM-binding protein YcdF (DUF218 family) n=1 Tax=Melghirimyces profundicolus TaxID=1242148 RepID=A0A2T6BW25_9BACL|nr:YdcF family protein [Melghirimyces profundicolus]PTX60263.1 uncharacterized SAM-binding protein YcdF (DUF218 family) [Melghirimyces profundicolus]
MIEWIVPAGAVAGIGWFGMWRLVSSYDGKTCQPVRREGAIVLGASLKNGQPGPALTERLDQALKMHREGLAPRLILSGGAPGKKAVEAQVMKDWLTAQGVPEKALLLEDRSTDTSENLSNTREILRRHGIRDVYLITHDFHMYRAARYAKRAGVPVTPAPFKSGSLRISYHKTRECLALVKYYLLR